MTEDELVLETQLDPALIKIFVGGTIPASESDLSQQLSMMTSDGFVIQTTADTIRLAGNSSKDTEFAAYDFLERYLGIRWLMPGEDGEHVPKHNTITIPMEQIVEEATTISRHVFWMETPADNVNWLRVNRMHDNIQFHHNLEYLFDPAVFSDHPEYYPGGVLPTPDNPAWNPCLNDATANAAIERIKAYFQQNPQASSYSLGVTDYRNHCESDPNHPNYPRDPNNPSAGLLNSVGQLNISNLYYPWVNQIVEGVLEDYPDKYFGLLAYAQVYDAPKNPDGSPYILNEHVVPYITDDRISWLDEDINDEAQTFMNEWKQSASSLGFYEYLYGSPYSLPRMYVQQMANTYQYATDNGVIGHVAEWLPNFGEGPKMWISAKLQWDSSQNVDKLANEWYQTAVGPAAAPYLQSYYEHWEQFWTERAFESDWYFIWKHTVPRSNYLNIYTHDYLTLITEEEMQQNRQLMQQVVDLAQTDEQRKRADFLMGTFEFYEASALSFPRTKPVPIPADEEEALAMIADFHLSIDRANFRLQYIEENQMRYLQMWDGVQQVLIDALNLYVDANEDESGTIRQALEQIKMAYLGSRDPATAIKTNAGEAAISQALDFDKGPWVYAKPFEQFLTTPDKSQPPVETKVRLLWDDTNLYVGYENFDTDIDGMVYNDNVSENWWDGATPDSVETFLGDTTKMYKGFFSNMNDVKFGFKMGVSPPTGRQGSPETPWKVYSQKYEDRWNTVQVIPFASIEIDPSTTSSLHGFFLRNYHGQQVYISSYGGNTWAVKDFGVIHLERPEPTEHEPITIVDQSEAKAVIVVPTPTDETIQGWRLTHPINEMVAGQMKIVSSRQYSGQYSLHVIDESTTQVQGLESSLVPVEEGENYTARVMAYSESGELPVILIYYYDDQRNYLYFGGGKQGDVAGEWSEINFTSSAPANAAYASVVLYSDSSGVSNIYFDEIQLEDSEGNQLLTENTGFETVASEAAELFAEYVHKASNVSLEIITEEQLQQNPAAYADFSRIYIGGTIPTGDLAIDQALATLPNDGYVMQIRDQRIHIIGPTSTGTEMGVRAFLEEYLGVQWAVPGGSEEYVPSMASIRIPVSSS